MERLCGGLPRSHIITSTADYFAIVLRHDVTVFLKFIREKKAHVKDRERKGRPRVNADVYG